MGETRTVVDLVLMATPSDGFNMLRERDLLELGFEALVVARRPPFPSNVVDAARVRLTSYGFDMERASDYWSGSH